MLRPTAQEALEYPDPARFLPRAAEPYPGDMLIAAAAITDSLAEPSQILAAQRSYPAALRGKWELPGGKVERGEPPAHAAVREIAEELGVDIKLGESLGTWPLGEGKEMIVWWAEAAGEPRAGTSHQQVKWCGAEELAELDWLKADIPLIKEITGRLMGPSASANVASDR